MPFFEEQLPQKAKLYIFCIISLGIPVLVYCLYDSITKTDLRWLYLAALAGIGSLFPVKIPSKSKNNRSLSITASDVFVFSAILLFGPELAVVISVIDGLSMSLRTRVRLLYKQLFNLSQLALVSFIVGQIFYQLEGQSPPLKPSELDSVAWLFIDLGFCALLYFLLNSGFVALAVALVTNQRFGNLWKQDFLWASLTPLAGASAAVFIFFYFDEIEIYALAVSIPIIVVIYFSYKMNLDRVKQAHKHVEQVNGLYHSTIAALAMAIDAKDQCTHGHVHRVQALALGLAKHCGVTEEKEIEGLRAAALLHDIGKLAIPEYILNKPSKLTESEMQKIKAHPAVGAEILASVPFPYPVVPYVRYHHEKWDGSGYPDGLKGDAIPLGARILSVADCYDALSSDRPYRLKLSRNTAMDYIRSEAGTSFDPNIVEMLIRNIDDLEERIEKGQTQIPESIIHKLGDSLSPEETEKPKITRTVFHDIASTHREIQALYEISQTLGKSLNISDTLALLSTKIKTLVPYSSCVIYLTDSTENVIVPHHASGIYSELLDNIEIRLGEGVSGWAAANNQTLLNASPISDFMDVQLLRSEFKSCLCAPLSINQSVVGVITLYSSALNGFQSDHLRLMENIAHRAAVAINNAIIYEDTQEDAYTDILTGLPNMRYFKIFADQELKRASRSNYAVTLLQMDLDFFKQVNDEYGHKVGDRMLIEIGHVLRNQLRKSDTCIRYGGDEFVGILPGVSKQLTEHTIARIQNAVDNHHLNLDDNTTVCVGISIGSATFPSDGQDLDTVMSVADRAMYHNKVSRHGEQRKEGAPVLPFEKKRADPA
ncbi:MAG: sensor domain-containing diguanylate cyclase/phosphohydrolase [Acidobacteriota bacterium]